MEYYEDEMISLGDSYYYLNFEGVDELLTYDNDTKNKSFVETETNVIKDENGLIISTEITTKKFDKDKEIDAARYDILSRCLNIVLEYNDVVEETLGLARGLMKTSLSFKFAFNTLIKYNILVKIP